MGLKAKFTFVFLAIALFTLCLVSGVSYYYISKISQIALEQTEMSLRDLEEQLVKEKTMDRVKAIQSYLQLKIPKQNKKLFRWESLQSDSLFHKLAIQTIGKTGYSALLIKKDKKIICFLHPNPKLIGVDLRLLDEKSNLWQMIQEVKSKEHLISKGYYQQIEPDGQTEKKFVVVMPIPDTPLIAMTSINAREIETPLKELEHRLLRSQKRLLWEFIAGEIIVGIIVIIVAVLFATHLVRPILYLTDIAERISLGELGVPIEITSTDEIGNLADALKRMQASLRKAIQKLQRQQTQM